MSLWDGGLHRPHDRYQLYCLSDCLTNYNNIWGKYFFWLSYSNVAYLGSYKFLCWYGALSTGCNIAGRWGENCNEVCGFCKNGADCDKSTGACPAGCSAGYRTTKCTVGEFGLRFTVTWSVFTTMLWQCVRLSIEMKYMHEMKIRIHRI